MWKSLLCGTAPTVAGFWFFLLIAKLWSILLGVYIPQVNFVFLITKGSVGWFPNCSYCYTNYTAVRIRGVDIGMGIFVIGTLFQSKIDLSNKLHSHTYNGNSETQVEVILLQGICKGSLGVTKKLVLRLLTYLWQHLILTAMDHSQTLWISRYYYHTKLYWLYCSFGRTEMGGKVQGVTWRPYRRSVHSSIVVPLHLLINSHFIPLSMAWEKHCCSLWKRLWCLQIRLL